MISFVSRKIALSSVSCSPWGDRVLWPQTTAMMNGLCPERTKLRHRNAFWFWQCFWPRISLLAFKTLMDPVNLTHSPSLKAGPVSWMCNLCKGPMLGLIFCCLGLDILNNFLTKRPHIFCLLWFLQIIQSCLPQTDLTLSLSSSPTKLSIHSYWMPPTSSLPVRVLSVVWTSNKNHSSSLTTSA